MSKSWYVKHKGRIVGPASSTQLKQLASTSKIKPDTRVRLGEDGEWIRASKVQGLFTQIAASQKQRQQQTASSVPAQPPHAPPVPAEIIPATKQCPMCGETIAATAVKCRHCNEFLDGRQRETPQITQPQFATSQSQTHTTVVVQQQGEVKSAAVALLLTFFFGPLGMLYSTPVGAIVMIGVWIVIGILCFFIIGLFLIPVAWIVQMVWAAMACQPRR